MAVEPPKCKVCGKSHWSNQPHSFETVTKPVTDLEAENAALRRQVAALTAELATLRKAPKTNAERQKEFRKRRAKPRTDA